MSFRSAVDKIKILFYKIKQQYYKLKKLYYKIKKFLYKLWRNFQTTSLYRLLTSPEHKFIFYKIVYGYLYGIFIGYLFWDMFIQNLGFSTKYNYIILCIMTIGIGLGCAFLSSVRCICVLIWVGFCGKAGRSVLKAVIMALVISGPINNIVQNAGEVVRSFTCATVLTYNLTKTRFDIMTKPFHAALLGVRKNASQIRESFLAVKEVIKPIEHEIEDDDPETVDNVTQTTEIPKVRRRSLSNDEIKDKYAHKLESRCELQIKKGAEKCVDAFKDAHDKCYEKLPFAVNTLLCWPMKIDHICNIAGSLGGGSGKKGPCDPKGVIDPNFQQNYGHLKTSKEQLMANFSNVNLHYKRVEPKEVPGMVSAQETASAIQQEFDLKRASFDLCMYVIKKLLSFFFFKIVISSYSYHKKYLGKIEHDNIYVTDYFKRIDERRIVRGQNHILPLKKIERQNIVDPTSARRLKVEVRGMVLHLVKFALEMITVSLFIIFDSLFYEILDLVRRHAAIEYRQFGRHLVNVTVNGTGIIASMLRASITGFNGEHIINTTTTNRPCLPRPNKLSDWCLIKIYGTFIIMLLLLYNETYVHRMRRIICSYFYPKREKKRVLFLYNKMLRRRKKLFKFMSENVKRKIRENRLHHDTNLLLTLRFKYPKYFGWLVFFKAARRHCLICGELEPRKRDFTRPFNFATCSTPNCPYVHCEECWFDIGEICLACTRYNGNLSEDQYVSDFNKSE